jgi:hypothetical protein
MMGGEASRS